MLVLCFVSFMFTFKRDGAYCFACVGQSVDSQVCRSLTPCAIYNSYRLQTWYTDRQLSADTNIACQDRSVGQGPFGFWFEMKILVS